MRGRAVNECPGNPNETAVLCRRRDHADSAGASREAVLIICTLLLIVMFSITAVVTRLYHGKIQTLANQWFAAGEGNFQSHHTDAALVDYRNALVYSPNNLTYQFHLAIALAASGHGDEARSYLINLLVDSPGSGEINLALARIAVQQDAKNDAQLYYNSAIYGVWDKNPLEMRWNVRRELCEYLLKQGDLSDAQPDLMALAQEVPPGDVQRQKEAAASLLRAGLWQRALDEFRLILKTKPRDDDALAGAGTASFQLGRYPQAIAYFERLSREGRSVPSIASMLDTCRAVESADPFLSGLSPAEKAKATAEALGHAQDRIADCANQHGESLSENPPQTTLQKLSAISRQMAKVWSELVLRRNPERVEPEMSLVFEMENAATRECGPPQDQPDQILALIERTRENPNP
jgi:tetratricopeptide (TPR) repeat protein